MTGKTGEAGERTALKYLKKQGMKIREKNFRAVRGEIDIIGQEGNTLVFVEVKTNYFSQDVPPELRVNTAKQRQVGKIARAYIQETGLYSMDCRFDVVGVILGDGGKRRVTHVKNAFWLPGNV